MELGLVRKIPVIMPVSETCLFHFAFQDPIPLEPLEDRWASVDNKMFFVESSDRPHLGREKERKRKRERANKWPIPGLHFVKSRDILFTREKSKILCLIRRARSPRKSSN